VGSIAPTPGPPGALVALTFLSDAWFTKVAELVAEHGGAPPDADMVMNLVVTGGPFDGERQMHMGAKGGHAVWGSGHVDGADVTMTTDYQTAKDVFVSGDSQAGMQAFMSGKVKVQGDLAKLMQSQASGHGPTPELTAAIRDITE
jgi:SCP-2 sterol transfer family